jgi:hypothetical protein
MLQLSVTKQRGRTFAILCTVSRCVALPIESGPKAEHRELFSTATIQTLRCLKNAGKDGFAERAKGPYSFLADMKPMRKLVQPERLALPSLWFEDTQYKTLGAVSGVAYRESAIYPALELD